MKHSTLLIGFAMCAFSSFASDYNLTVPISEEKDGLTTYIIDYDTNQKIDSAVVTNGKAIFIGSVDAPRIARVVIGNNNVTLFVLEGGNLAVNGNDIVGSPLNDRLHQLALDQKEILNKYQNLPKDATDEQKEAIIAEYIELIPKAFEENSDNALGYYLFLQQANEWDLEEFDNNIQKYPSMKDYKRVNDMRNFLVLKEETSVGNKFKDFEITFEGVTKRLSDYVGKGKYTIVDFWASWCGPCIREIRVLKELWDKYSDKGLDFLGVAVWDDPQDTRNAIEQYQIPWQQILNAQSIPTDLYGIPGIPCIILFDPEGIIVSRDKQEEELVADVEAAMKNILN